MLKIKVKEDKLDIERALKIFKKKIRDTKLIEKIRDNEEYIKPSELKRNQKRKAIYKNKKNN
jgi:small subunit ribosomal protein S21